MSGSDLSSRADAHQQCWALLPWVANERVTSADFAQIEPHLRGCSACQKELQSQRELRELVRSQDGIMLAPQTSLQKLMQRIDQEQGPPARSHARGAHGRPALASAARAPERSRWLTGLALAQALVITILLSALWLQSREVLKSPRFTTLTTHEAVATRPVIRVVFAANVPLGQVNALLRSVQAQVLAGPSEAGVYTLGLPPPLTGAAQVAQAVATLRTDPRVQFAEAALARSASP